MLIAPGILRSKLLLPLKSHDHSGVRLHHDRIAGNRDVLTFSCPPKCHCDSTEIFRASTKSTKAT